MTGIIIKMVTNNKYFKKGRNMQQTQTKTNCTKHSLALVIMLGLLAFLTSINTPLFNVVINEMATSLKVTANTASWFVFGYSLFIGIGAMLYGKLADNYPIRILFIISIIIADVGSILGLIFHQFLPLLIARFLQAIGSSSFVVMSIVSVKQFIDQKWRPFGFSFISAMIIIGVGMASLISGICGQYFGWQSLFLVMFISIIPLIGVFFLMPKKNAYNDTSSKIDIIGTGLLFLAILFLLLGINRKLWYLVPCVIAGVLFYLYDNKHANSLVDFTIFKNNRFVNNMFGGFTVNFVICGTLLAFPTILKELWHFSTLKAGVIMFIASIFAMIASFSTNILIRHVSLPQLATSGLVLMLISTIGMVITVQHYLWLSVVFVTLIFISFSLSQYSFNTMVPLSLSNDQVGMGTGFYQLNNFMGVSIGPAIFSRLMIHHSGSSIGYLICAILILVITLFFWHNMKNVHYPRPANLQKH